jgi:hypothetical protein
MAKSHSLRGVRDRDRQTERDRERQRETESERQTGRERREREEWVRERREGQSIDETHLNFKMLISAMKLLRCELGIKSQSEETERRKSSLRKYFIEFEIFRKGKSVKNVFTKTS